MVVIALLAAGVQSLLVRRSDTLPHSQPPPSSCYSTKTSALDPYITYSLSGVLNVECCDPPTISSFELFHSQETHTWLWNLIVQSLWITNPHAFPISVSSLIYSSYGSVAYATRISSIRVGYASMACNTNLVPGVITLSSDFWNSSHRSTGSFIIQFNIGYGRWLNASAITFSLHRWYWKFIS